MPAFPPRARDFIPNVPSFFDGLLPAAIIVSEGPVAAHCDDSRPEEAAQLAHAVAVRRAEFAAGRALARRSLKALGLADATILAGIDRVPLWPPGFTGSIAHTRSLAAAAMARIGDAASVGIDLEDVGRFHPRLDRHILTARERDRLAGLDDESAQTARAIIFAAKEAFYKCQYMQSHARLGFQDAEMAIDRAGGAFALTLLVDAPPFVAGRVFAGRFRVAGGVVAAALFLPARVDGPRSDDPS